MNGYPPKGVYEARPVTEDDKRGPDAAFWFPVRAGVDWLCRDHRGHRYIGQSKDQAEQMARDYNAPTRRRAV